MARVTVEDCVLKIPNRFELVMIAAQRARDISSGAQITIDRDRDKNPVVALREIADETVRPTLLRETLVGSLQRVLPDDDDEADEIGSLSQSAEALPITAAAKVVLRQAVNERDQTYGKAAPAAPAPDLQSGPAAEDLAPDAPSTGDARSDPRRRYRRATPSLA